MPKRLRLGMVGGGQGAFIGAVHRIASRIDDRYELVAGCLSSSADKALLSAKEIGIDSNRSYPDFQTMAESEASREDGIQVVSIVTPNHMHASPAIEFIDCANNLNDKIWQAKAGLRPIKTVVVMGDSRTYEYTCLLRAVSQKMV